MEFSDFSSVIIPSLILSTFVLIGKPIIVSLVLGALGYRKRTAFLTGISLAQISEFSLILVFLGASLNQIPGKIVPVITVTGVITFVASTYMISHSHALYMRLHKYLSVFERRNTKKEEIIDPDNIEEIDDHVVVIGGDILGRSIVEALPHDEKIIVVDFDPEIVRRWNRVNVRRLFGDITDFDIQERASLKKAKLVISTIPDIQDNFLLLKMLNRENRRAKIFMMSLEPKDAKSLYKAGADYVILPHLAGGRQIAKLIKEGELGSLDEVKDKDLSFIS